MRQENSYWKVQRVLEDRKMLQDQNTLAKAVGPVAPESVVTKPAPETSSCPETVGGPVAGSCDEDPIPASPALGGHDAQAGPTKTDEEHVLVWDGFGSLTVN